MVMEDIDHSDLEPYLMWSQKKTNIFCNNCNKKGEAIIKRVPNYMVIVDSERFLTKSEFVKKTQTMKEIELASIAKSLVYTEKKFNLKGVIQINQAKSHFITCVDRNGVWKTYDDLKHVRKVHQIKSNDLITPVMLIYARDFSYSGSNDTLKPVPENIELSEVRLCK